jgi:hypothetical protein
VRLELLVSTARLARLAFLAQTGQQVQRGLEPKDQLVLQELLE